MDIAEQLADKILNTVDLEIEKLMKSKTSNTKKAFSLQQKMNKMILSMPKKLLPQIAKHIWNKTTWDRMQIEAMREQEMLNLETKE